MGIATVTDAMMTADHHVAMTTAAMMTADHHVAMTTAAMMTADHHVAMTTADMMTADHHVAMTTADMTTADHHVATTRGVAAAAPGVLALPPQGRAGAAPHRQQPTARPVHQVPRLPGGGLSAQRMQPLLRTTVGPT